MDIVGRSSPEDRRRSADQEPISTGIKRSQNLVEGCRLHVDPAKNQELVRADLIRSRMLWKSGACLNTRRSSQRLDEHAAEDLVRDL